MKRPAPKRPAATPELARKALRLHRKNITGDELAHKLKVGPAEVDHLLSVATLIERAEGYQLTQKEADVLKAIARVVARNVMLGRYYTKTGDVDFAGGFRRGTCAKHIVALGVIGLVEMILADRITLTRAGWAFAWETGLIKQNWTVPA